MKVSKAISTYISSLSIFLISPVYAACNNPQGLDELDKKVKDKLSDMDEFPYLWLPLAVPHLIGEVIKAETPIQFRVAQIHGSTCYNTAAKYDKLALDIWGKDTNRICDASRGSADWKLHERIAIAYTFYYSGITLVPSSEDTMRPVFENVLGLDVSRLDSTDPGTPWGLARIVVEEMQETLKNDGWNADGKLANEFNSLPYSDFDYTDEDGNAYERYEVQPRKGDSTTSTWPWQPLVESDGLGYFTKQEHVTPFAGFTGRLYGMGRDYYNGFVSPAPEYDYLGEAYYVLEQTAAMATNDRQKAMIEFYDSKFTSLLPMMIEFSIRRGDDELNFWFSDMVTVNTMYDAMLLVWKEKVRHNAVRPTNVVHELLGDEIVSSYAGPFEGVQELQAKDWQPFIRTMPHAEYPSGSACICTAFTETMQMLTDGDELPFDIVQTFKAGTSRTEPGVTPEEDVVVTYSSWSQIAEDCGQSRLYGGMHFEESVIAANELCSDFIDPVVHKANLLRLGDAAGALFDPEANSMSVTPNKKCDNLRCSRSGRVRN